MSIFDVIKLLGGLAMFLFGMRYMGDGLKESASGPLKVWLEKLTSTTMRSFMLGFLVTAIIQSSKATIVIVAGLVGTGILSLGQSVGILIGANIGTTMTGQIIRLIDLDGGGASFVQLFNPSTLGPLALIIGVVISMAAKKRKTAQADTILIGFGILFSGLTMMSSAVAVLTESPEIQSLLYTLGSNLFLAFALGAGIALVLQSASASVGVVQAFATSGLLSFSMISSLLLGIYLGECITTGLVVSIGAKADAKRVGMVNILYNIAKIILVAALLAILSFTHLWPSLFTNPVTSGTIADANTIYNIISAILLLPLARLFVSLSKKIIRTVPKKQTKVEALLDALNPAFFATPALAFGRCYDALMEMYRISRENVKLSIDLLYNYDEKVYSKLEVNEREVDDLNDGITNYLTQLSGHISAPAHVEILNHYYAVVNDFERMSDHAMNIRMIAHELHENGSSLSPMALKELKTLREILEQLLDYAGLSFEKRDLKAARHIEPLEQVMDDLIVILKDNRITRLRARKTHIFSGTEYLNLLSEIERISDICSNIGVATISRALPEIGHHIHDYIHRLHNGEDERFNQEYQEAKQIYMKKLNMSTSQS